MLVWQGWGILVAGIPFVLIVVVTAIWTAMFGEGTATANSTLIIAIALLASAPLLYLVDKRLEARPGRTMIDKETGEEVELRGAHTLFFIRMRYWAWVAVILGVLLLVVAMLPQS